MKPASQPRNRDDSALAVTQSESVAAVQGLSQSAASKNQPDKQPTAALGSDVGRIPALDFTKGALVLTMVLYHWLNYFVGVQGYYYRYLRFLSPSFIFITGFLITHVYISRPRIADSRSRRRLAIRGIKILMIFIVMNSAIYMTPLKPGKREALSNILSPAALSLIFTGGNMRDGKLVAFYVLVPISYLLIMSACLLPVCRYYKHVFHAATILTVFAALIVSQSHRANGNLEMISFGLFGVSVGYVRMDRINKCLKRQFMVVLAYLLYVVIISVWGVPYLLQIVGVPLSLMCLYLLGKESNEDGQIAATLIRLGKYSLFGYIVQIFILQLLRRVMGVDLAMPRLMLSFLCAVTLTVISVGIVDRARTRIQIADRLYRAVFS